jgi:hypothetical protein
MTEGDTSMVETLQASEVADVEIVAEGEPVITRALVHSPRRSEVLHPLDLTEQKNAMELYQSGLREILDVSDWQNAGRGEKFVKKSGWRKIAAWFDLSIELVRDSVERDEDGQVCRACVWARAVAASGRFADGDGYCDVNESRFKEARGRQKLENDLRGTATTRAVNRAISNLVGMGAVSAEEVSDGPATPPHGPPYDEAIAKVTGAAVVQLAGGDPELGKALWKQITADLGGYMPQAAALSLIHAAEASAPNRVPDIQAPDPT